MEVKEKLSINAVIRYAILIAVGIILLYPLFWMIGSAFKQNIDIFGTFSIFPPPGRGTLDNFYNAWHLSRNNTILFYFGNTMRFLIPKTIFTVISCTLTAYAVARFSFPGKKIVFTTIIVTLLMPEIAFRIPIFLLFRDLGLIDTFAALYIQDIFAVNSFFVFMIIQFMRTIPRELDEAAHIDGCSAIQTLLLIITPVLKPIIITVALLTFMWGMNDFQGPLIFLNSPQNTVLSVALQRLLDGDSVIIFGEVFAAATMALIPLIAIFFAGSKYFVDGVANSGGKE